MPRLTTTGISWTFVRDAARQCRGSEVPVWSGGRWVLPVAAAGCAAAFLGWAAGTWHGGAARVLAAPMAQGTPTASPTPTPNVPPPPPPPPPIHDLTTLRLHGLDNVCGACNAGEGNGPATAGDANAVDPNTGRVPEDPPYTDPRGPFDPTSDQAPAFDFATWNPAWISERLAELAPDWPGLEGPDEVGGASNIRIGGVNGSQKVWVRHWYEPTRLDKDLNADDCLTDGDGDGRADAPLNPDDRGAGADEWYPAVMTELTYMLLDNDRILPEPSPASLGDAFPRPACGPAGATRMVFPVGVESAEAEPGGARVGRGLTSLDADFDGSMDMINVTSEALLAASVGVSVDFDGDGALDALDPDGTPLTCDEMVVLHTDATIVEDGGRLQMLDHYARVRSVSDNSAVIEVWYTGDLAPRRVDSRSIGVGALALAGDVGPMQVLPAGASNLGDVPPGAWFVTVEAVDPVDGSATLVVGRALGAPCASMESAPRVTNRSPGGPWFLKRFYVDGHEFNTVAILTCSTDALQYITLRAPLPKVPVTIEQHSVQLQPYGPIDSLVLPPPFNHEHAILEDVAGLNALDDLLPDPFDPPSPRPDIRYMGGPIGPVAPVLSDGDPIIYEGRDPARPVGPYDTIEDLLATRWFYVDEDVNPGFAGQLREKYGAPNLLSQSEIGPEPPDVPDGFFYNEQVLTRARHVTEFYMPDQPDPDPGADPEVGQAYDPDRYHVTPGMINPTSRWRRWTLPDAGVPASMPPPPTDLTDDVTGFDPLSGTYGAVRRAEFHYDPDLPQKVFANDGGVRLHGGFPFDDELACSGAADRPAVVLGAGDPGVATDVAGYPVEVLPYTDPFAPFNPQHPHAPRTDSLTFNPAYMDEYRNFDEDLRFVYRQIANAAQNARQKVYHRAWYQPDYVTKIVDAGDCSADLTFPAVVQEYTYLYMDTTDNPIAVPPATSRFAFPLAARADELPLPNAGGSLPAGGAEGRGLTTFDADFDGYPDAVTVHHEASLADYLDAHWQSVRPVPPVGPPPPPLPGPRLDFDGDGVLDDFDGDCASLSGDEMVVLALESATIDTDAGTPESPAIMFLDYLVRLENVSADSASFRIYFTGGNPFDARPEAVLGVQTLEVGDALLVDRFQDRITRVRPGETNIATDGAWFLFLEDIASVGERATFTVGRALGAAGSAIDDGAGGHDLAPGDPWYLKRFYADGHQYDVVAVMTRTAAGSDPRDPGECNGRFAFITLRAPVPKGDYFNPQDSLFQQGYFLEGGEPSIPVLPPFNAQHTVALDIERLDPDGFAARAEFGACVGPLAPAEPLVETILDEARDPRLGTELRETYHGRDGVDGDPPDFRDPDPLRARDGWQVHQVLTTPENFTDISVPDGQRYLLTLGWRTPAGRIALYGCTRAFPGPFDADEAPPIDHYEIVATADTWAPPFGVLPSVNVVDPPQTRPALADGSPAIVPYHDAQCSVTETVRAKLFYDPTDPNDIYVNRRGVRLPFEIADLSVEKRASDAEPVAGEDLTYTITVRNDGPDDVALAVITDSLPTGVTYLSDTDSCAEGPPGWLNCSLGPLPAFTADSFAVTVRLDPALATDTALINLAGVRGPDTFDPDPGNNLADEPATVRRMADVRLTKSASVPNPPAGTQFVYTLVAHNDGPSDVSAVTITDTLPAGVTYVSDTGGGACQLWGGSLLECYFGDVPAGGNASVSVTVLVGAGVPPGTLLRNAARATGGSPDPNPANNQAHVDAFVTAVADLALSKRAAPNPVHAGDLLTYTLTITNSGPSAAPSLRVVDTLPADVAFAGATGAACSGVPLGGTGTLTCTLGGLAAGDSTSFQIHVLVDPSTPPGSSIHNSATVDGPGSTDPSGGDNSSGTSVGVTASAELAVAKSAPADVFVGAEFDWQVTVTNAGPSDAQAVVVTDTLPAGVSYVSDTDSCALAAPATYACNLGKVAVGEVRAFDIRMAVDAGVGDGQVLFNAAAVGSDTPDPDPSDDTTIDDATARRRADLMIEKSGPATAVAGQAAVYQVRVDNAGPSTATGVVVTDTLPAGTSFVTSTGGCAEAPPGSGQLTCALPDIAAGSFRVFTIVVTLDSGLAESATLGNLSGATSSEVDPDPSDNTDEHDLTVVRRSDLTIQKSDDTDPVTAGEEMTFTLRVTNLGPSDSAGSTVVDDLPGGMTYISDDGGCAEAPAGRLTCPVGPLPAGGQHVIRVRVAVDPALAEGAVLVNSTSVTEDAGSDPAPGNDQDTEAVTVRAVADLAVTKRAADGAPVAGTLLQYTIAVTNAGPSAVASAVVTDHLPVELVYVGDTDSCAEVPPASGRLTCSLGALAPGASAAFTLTVRVAPDVPPGTAVANTAHTDSSVTDPDPSDNSDTETVDVAAEADLELLKAAPATAEPGSRISYSLVVNNLGPSDATSVTVTDQLPVGATFVSSAGASCAEAPPGTLTCSVGAVPANGSAVFTVEVDLDPGLSDGAVLTNVATVGSPLPDPDPGNDQATADTTIELANAANLAIVKSALNPNPAAGESYSYRIEVANLGPRAASDVRVTDTLPAGVTYLFDSDACVEGPAGTLVCSPGPLVAGGNTSFTITAALDSGAAEGSVLTNAALTTSELPDPVPANNFATADITVTRSADLALTKDDAPDPVAAGRRLTYTLSVRNWGPSAASGVVVTDSLPAGVTLVGTDGSCIEGPPGTVVCQIGDLADGATATVEVYVDVDPGAAGASLVNDAVVGGAEPDPDPGDNAAQATTGVVGVADLLISKRASHPARVPGAPLTYTVGVTNTGPSDAGGVWVTDTLPSDFVYVGDSAGCDSSALPQLSCALGNLASGASVTFSVWGAVSPAAIPGSILTNSAVATGDQTDPDPSDNTAEVPVEVLPAVDLELRKTSFGEVTTTGNPPGTALLTDAVTAGRLLTYTLTVTNSGPSLATGVLITDDLPAGAVFVFASPGCDGTAPPLVVCTMPDLAAASTAQVTIAVLVGAGVPAGSVLDNAAVASAEQPDLNSADNAAINQALVSAKADLRLTKTVAPPVAVAGDLVTYTLTITNSGPSDAPGVLLQDVLPAPLSYESDTGGCVEAPPGSGSLSCALGPLAAGGSIVLTISARVGAGLEGSTVFNDATTAPDGIADPNLTDNDAQAALQVAARADLSVVKDALGAVTLAGSPPGSALSGSAVTAGRELTYTVRIDNLGPGTASAAVLTDSLPVGVTYLSDDGGCSAAALPALVCPLGGIAPGAAVTVTVRVRVSADLLHGAQLINLASVGSDALDPESGNDQASAGIYVEAASNLSLVKAVEPQEAAVGQTVTFTLSIGNAGPSTARGVVVTDTLPFGITYISDSAGCTEAPPASGQLVCNLGDLAPGALVVVTVVAEVGAGLEGTSPINTAGVAVTGGGFDPDPSNNHDHAAFDVLEAVALALDKRVLAKLLVPGSPPTTVVSDSEITAGLIATYTLSITNTGISSATGVVVTDSLPADTVFKGSSIGCFESSPGVVVCSVGAIPSGTASTFEIYVKYLESIAEGSILQNSAVVSAAQPEADLADNTAQAELLVRSHPNLSIAKTAAPAEVLPGDLITFTLVAANGGPSDAAGVTVSDTLPSGLSYEGDSHGCDTAGLPLVSCDIGALVSGSSVLLTLTGRVDGGTPPGTTTNTAQVMLNAPGLDPEPANNLDGASFDVLGRVDLSLAKDAAPTSPLPGDPLTYTLGVVNNGPGEARSVTIVDALPAEFVYGGAVGASCALVGSTLTCGLGDMPESAVRAVTVAGAVGIGVPPGTSFSNSAEVSAALPDLDPADNTDAATVTVGAGLLGVGLDLDSDLRATLTWDDAPIDAAGFKIEASAGGSGLVPVATVAGAAFAGLDASGWTSLPLLARTSYAFRVTAIDAAGRPGPLAAVELRTPARELGADACVSAQLSLQGRNRHGGVLVRLDGIPARLSDRAGDASLCGMAPGRRELVASHPGYLAAAAVVPAVGGATAELPTGSLAGGDVDADGRIDLADLVHVGAARGADGEGAGHADINGDGAVDLLDLLLVSGNFDRAGPTPWGGLGATEADGTARSSAEPSGVDLDADAHRSGGAGVDAVAQGAFELTVTARGVRDVYGADVALAFDPSRLRPLDALDKPGLQALPGEAWSEPDGAFVALNRADGASGTVRLAATRLHPAPAVRGDVAILTARFVAVEAGDEGALESLELVSARLLRADGNAVDVRIDGTDLRSPVDWTRIFEQLHLPIVRR